MSGLTRFSFGTFCDGRRISGSWAGCPVARDGPHVRAWGPDVRADLADSGALWIADAGFPGQGPDVRDMSGCPVAVAPGSSSFSFLRSRAHLALVLGLSMVYTGVPEYAQGPRLK